MEKPTIVHGPPDKNTRGQASTIEKQTMDDAPTTRCDAGRLFIVRVSSGLKPLADGMEALRAYMI
jgi:hypothetical protein